MRFVRGWPALVVRDHLFVTDLHVGLERGLEDRGLSFPSRTGDMLKNVKVLMKKNKCGTLVVLGDLKHRVPGSSFQERAEVPWFLRQLLKDFKVVLIRGNHDSGLERMTNLKVVDDFSLDDFGFFHGHSWPSQNLVEKSRVLVIGHVHPMLVFKDKLGVVHQKQCWVVAKLDEKRMVKRYGRNVDKLVVMPAFNPLVSGVHDARKALTGLVVSEERFLLDLTKIV